MPNGANLDNVRTGYKATLDLATDQASHTWLSFNALVLVNTVIGTVLAHAFTASSMLPVPWVVALFGFLICLVVWLPLTKRGLIYQDYYVASARDLEQQLAPVAVIAQGQVLGEGGQVGVGGGQLRMTDFARLRSRHAMYAAIGGFMVIYLAAGLVLLLRSRTAMEAQQPRSGHFVLVDKEGAPHARLETDGHGGFSFELTERDGKVIWKVP